MTKNLGMSLEKACKGMEITPDQYYIAKRQPQVLSGFNGERLAVLDQADIIRIYASGGKVFAVTESGEFPLRLRLYELDERLRILGL